MNSNILKMIEYPKQGIHSKSIFKNKKMDVSLFSMAKHSEMDEHTSTKHATIQVLEGKGIFNLEGNKIKMNPGTFIIMNKNAVHSLKAEENTSFLLILN